MCVGPHQTKCMIHEKKKKYLLFYYSYLLEYIRAHGICVYVQYFHNGIGTIVLHGLSLNMSLFDRYVYLH